tara:strand:- start:2399 stop:3118 length:720 start_codon:yes stop_codon:yes gene_type:complete
MALDDILRVAGIDNQGQQLGGAFSNDQSVNVGLGLASIDGRIDDLTDAEKNATLDVTPARNKNYLLQSLQGYQKDLIETVQDNWGYALEDGFGAGEDAKSNLVGFLTNTESVDGAGSESLREKHDAAYQATELLRDPRKMKEKAKEYAVDRVGQFDDNSEGLKGVMRFIYTQNPGLAEQSIYDDATARIMEFDGEIGTASAARTYLGQIYDAQPDQGAQDKLALEVGRTVYNLNSEDSE